MTLEELFKLQNDLDKYIVNKKVLSGEIAAIHHNNSLFLGDRLHALSVEVSELSNATRCFKYWSTKPAEGKDILLDEYSDVLHFVLSVGNTLKFTPAEVENAYMKKHAENYKRQDIGY